MTEPPTSDDSQKAATRWRYWVPRLATAIFVPLLLLALTEGVLRLFNVGYSTELMSDCTVGGQPSSCYNLFFAAPFFPPGMIKAPQFYTIPKVKTPNTYRIFCWANPRPWATRSSVRFQPLSRSNAARAVPHNEI